MLHLLSRYTSKHSRVCTVCIALALSNSDLSMREFSLIKPLIPTITFKDTMWTQTFLSYKQVVKVSRM